MKSIFSSLLCMFLLFGTLNYAYSQSQHELSNYNLPPGYKLNPKKIIIDLSYKIDKKELGKEIKPSQLQVLKQISEEELLSTSVEYQEYVQEGKNYISSLSKNVRNTYTELELWYIYAFDQKLKNRLTQIN